MSEEKFGEGSSAVSPAEMAQIFAVPAPYVNRFFVTGSGATARLTFAEQRVIEEGGDPVMNVRSAVVLDLAEVFALRDLLTKMEASVTMIDVNAVATGG